MFLRFTTRKKNGKEHRYYSLVENRRVSSGRVVQRPVLYLGEINDSQKAAWTKVTDVFDTVGRQTRELALSPITSKPATRGRIKTSHSEAFDSYQISGHRQGAFQFFLLRSVR